MDPRLEQFREDSRDSKHIVVCVKCGSTRIDQNFRNQIKCYNCGNVSIWDSNRFTIARRGDEHDVVKGLQAADHPSPPLAGDWHSAILLSLLPLLHKLPDMVIVYSGSEIPKIQREDFKELLGLWDDAKIKVDAAIENLLRRDASIEDEPA